MTYISTTDFYTEVRKGNVLGHELIGLRMVNPSIGTSFEDLSSFGGTMVQAAAAETWEIVSDNVNDTALGSGARSVTVNYTDDSYLKQEITVDLDGATPVTLNSDHFRIIDAVVETAGSSGRNEGTVLVRVSGGGTTRNTIGLDIVDALGLSNSQDGYYTAPAGKSIIGGVAIPLFGIGASGFIRPKVRRFGADQPFLIGSALPFYQSGRPIEVNFVLPEKTDLVFEVQSNNENEFLACPTELLQVDNDQLDGPTVLRSW